MYIPKEKEMIHMKILTLPTLAAAALMTACSDGSGGDDNTSGLPSESEKPVEITEQNKERVINSSQQGREFAQIGVNFADTFAGQTTASSKQSLMEIGYCDTGTASEEGNTYSFNDCEAEADGTSIRVNGSMTVNSNGANFNNLKYEIVSGALNTVLVYDGSIGFESTTSTETYNYENFIITLEGEATGASNNDSTITTVEYSVFYDLDGTYTWTETASGEKESYDLSFTFDFQSDDLDPEAVGNAPVGSIKLVSNPDIFTADVDSYPSGGKLVIEGANSSSIVAEFGVCGASGQASISVNGGTAACESFSY